MDTVAPRSQLITACDTRRAPFVLNHATSRPLGVFRLHGGQRLRQARNMYKYRASQQMMLPSLMPGSTKMEEKAHDLYALAKRNDTMCKGCSLATLPLHINLCDICNNQWPVTIAVDSRTTSSSNISETASADYLCENKVFGKAMYPAVSGRHSLQRHCV